MSEWVFRLAEPRDAEAFSEWAGRNSQIEPRDLAAGMKKTNPTVLTFCVEKDGVAIADAPVFLSATVAHLNFNPDANGKDKLRAMQMLVDGTSALMVQFGVREIVTLSKPEYPIAQWALKHGFEQDTRNLFRLDLNKEMTEVK